MVMHIGILERTAYAFLRIDYMDLPNSVRIGDRSRSILRSPRRVLWRDRATEVVSEVLQITIAQNKIQ